MITILDTPGIRRVTASFLGLKFVDSIYDAYERNGIHFVRLEVAVMDGKEVAVLFSGRLPSEMDHYVRDMKLTMAFRPKEDGSAFVIPKMAIEDASGECHFLKCDMCYKVTDTSVQIVQGGPDVSTV